MKTLDDITKSERVFNVDRMGLLNIGFIKLTDAGTCTVIWSEDENGWEHVSISPKKRFKLPTWNDMSQVKDIFFNENEEVLQLHPKKSEYVDVKDNCLHLWKPKGVDIMDTLEAEVQKGDKA